MGLLVDIRDDVAAIRQQAAYDERTRRAWERIAECEARDREEERRRAAG
jgi:hypothetical protein